MIHEKVRDRILMIKKQKKLSFYRIAKDGNLADSTLSNLKDLSNTNPGIVNIAKVCKGLGVSIGEFFSDSSFFEIDH